MTDRIINAARRPIRLFKRARIWLREREWERNYLRTRSSFSATVGEEIARQLRERGSRRLFGTFVHGETNVGDDVQTIAQLGHLPLDQGLRAFDRDKLAYYRGDRRIFIMNGWFGELPWPPSPLIDPIFISFHIAGNELARKEHARYYKQFEPIGCRDQATAEKLRNIGVDAYFSGCLTLTLNNPYRPEDRGNDVVIVDAHLENDGVYPPSTPALLKRLVPESILKNAVYAEQEVASRHDHHYSYKTARALELLDLYARAKLVVTTRLHCALPCLAMGTPVVFMHRNYETDIRFDGYREFLKGHSLESRRADVNWDAPSPTEISPLRNRVILDIKNPILST